jgi:proteic killer suppression protein
MEISFKNQSLRRNCEDKRRMKKRFGEISDRLSSQLAILHTAPSLADVPTGPPSRCHLLKGDRKGQFAVTVSGNWRLVFEPDCAPLPLRKGGSLDQALVRAVCILEVVDYHGK